MKITDEDYSFYLLMQTLLFFHSARKILQVSGKFKTFWEFVLFVCVCEWVYVRVFYGEDSEPYFYAGGSAKVFKK